MPNPFTQYRRPHRDSNNKCWFLLGNPTDIEESNAKRFTIYFAGPLDVYSAPHLRTMMLEIIQGKEFRPGSEIEVVLNPTNEFASFSEYHVGETKRDFTAQERLEMKSGSDYMDSSGLGALIKGLKEARLKDGNVIIVTHVERILRVFEQTGLDLIFDIIPDPHGTAENQPAEKN